MSLRDHGGKYVKGNVSRTLQVTSATVTDVFRKIEAALFAEEE